jgi:hypothetical protein
MIRTPDFVTLADLDAAIGSLGSAAAPMEKAKVRLEAINEGRCIQVLHIGPCSEESSSIRKMNQFAKENALSFHGLHHEIYLTDPRTVPEEERRTILRMPVC